MTLAVLLLAASAPLPFPKTKAGPSSMPAMTPGLYNVIFPSVDVRLWYFDKHTFKFDTGAEAHWTFTDYGKGKAQLVLDWGDAGGWKNVQHFSVTYDKANEEWVAEGLHTKRIIRFRRSP